MRNYKKLRLAKEWSRPQLAWASGISIDIIKRLETGKNVKPENVKRIEEALFDKIE